MTRRILYDCRSEAEMGEVAGELNRNLRGSLELMPSNSGDFVRVWVDGVSTVEDKHPFTMSDRSIVIDYGGVKSSTYQRISTGGPSRSVPNARISMRLGDWTVEESEKEGEYFLRSFTLDSSKKVDIRTYSEK